MELQTRQPPLPEGTLRTQTRSSTSETDAIQAGSRDGAVTPPGPCREPDSAAPAPATGLAGLRKLVAEVKGIYAGLVSVEVKMDEAERAVSVLAPPWEPQQNHEQWQLLLALRSTFLHKHDDFFVASQHPSASPALRRLASKLAMRSRMWRHSTAILADRRPSGGFMASAMASSKPMSLASFQLISQRMSQLLCQPASPADPSLDGADGELLKWLQKTEDMFDWLFDRFMFGGDRFQVLIYIFYFYCFFFEFPRGLRHLCTTMPWTIWPALVVLWGVCWMFIQPWQRQDEGVEGGVARQDVNLSPVITQGGGNPAVGWNYRSPYLQVPDYGNMPPVYSGYAALSAFSSPNIDEGLPISPLDTPPLGMFGNEFPILPNGPFQTLAVQQQKQQQQLYFTPAAPIPPTLASPPAHPPQTGLNPPYQSPPSAPSPSSIIYQSPRLPLSNAPLQPPNPGAPPAKQPRKFTCPTCLESFGRKETLDRHQREQNHSEAVSAEHLCPNQRCRKAVPGAGFRRAEKLRAHLRNKSCIPIPENKRTAKARRRGRTPAAAAVVAAAAAAESLSPSPPQRPSPGVDLERAGTEEAETPSSSAAEHEDGATATPTATATGSARGTPPPNPSSPTIAERIALQQRCCQHDSQARGVVVQALAEKEAEVRVLRELLRRFDDRVAGTYSDLGILVGQQR